MHFRHQTLGRLAAVLALIGLAAASTAAGALPVHFDFESGDMQGWRVVSGRFGPLPSLNDYDRWSGNFGKQGRYFIGTCELGNGPFDDGMTGEIRSPSFVLHYRHMSLLVGGGNQPRTCYVALCRWRDDAELITETGRNAERMTRRIWDVSQFVGERVYLKVVDNEKGGWGHINVDDVREITPEEALIMAREKAVRSAEVEARFKKWARATLGPSRRNVYRGDALRAISFPMGGIGAGNISIGGTGDLREWEIFNSRHWMGRVLPGSFFAVRARATGKQPIARLLQTTPIGSLPTVETIEFIGEYPIAMLRYHDRDLPVDISLEAFSPIIPFNSKESGLPAVIFIFTARNKGRSPVEVSFLGSLKNGVGYDGMSEIKGPQGLENPGFDGNVNRLVRKDGFSCLTMTSESLAPDAKHYGSMVLACSDEKASAAPAWSDSAHLWPPFVAQGRLAGAEATPSATGHTWNGAIASALRLKPGEAKSVLFVIAWHFPNRYGEWDLAEASCRVGNMYNNWFADAQAAAEYVVGNYERLCSQTRLFRDTLYDGTLPYWFLDAITANISTLCTTTCLWLEDGTFAGFEGSWCCPMNCTHVWNYEQTMASLFPDLERNVRHTDLKIQMEPNGMIHHRTFIPVSLPRRNGPATDGQLGTVLKVYREHLRSPDGSFLKDSWPEVKRAMDFVMNQWDSDGDGVIVDAQPNTYDISFYGANTFIGSLYLAALQAAAEMASIQGDRVSAARYRDRCESGRAKLDRELWNGEYYIQKYDAEKFKEHQYGTGCLADQMFGQWWAHVLGVGYIFPEKRVKKSLASIFEHNFRKDFTDWVHSQRVFASGRDKGLLVCTWPKGGRPATPVLYCDEVWTGIEYQVAAHMICEGMIDEALYIVKAARDRYNGTERNPWNEIECGDHYARAMSSWSLLLAAQGYYYDGPAGVLRLAPNITPERFRSFFSTASGYGTFSQTRKGRTQTDTLDLKQGTLELTRLVFGLPGSAKRPRAKVTIAGAPADAQSEFARGTLTITFPSRIKLQAGQSLRIKAEW
jgi:uncharacterized protein (DUF608 family)